MGSGVPVRLMRVLTLFILSALAPRGGWGIEKIEFKPSFNFFSPPEDVQLGKENAAQIEKQLPLVTEAEAVDYLNRLGKTLVGFAPNNKPEYVWRFKIVNSGDINAFALPGGFIYVNRGAIEAAENEAELAGVMAHEAGHVVMRHGTHMASEELLVQAPLAFATGILGQSGSLLSQVAQLGLGLGVNSLFLKYSRSAEAQADEVGTYILYQAGYDPRAMAQFFGIIQKKYPQRTLQFFSNHPSPENRIKDVDAEITRLGPPRAEKTGSAEFGVVKRRLAAMRPPPNPPDAPSAGPPSPPPPPSQHLVRYDGKVFTLSYPDNWQVQRSEDGVALYPPRGMVTGNDRETAQAYGVAISRARPAQENWGLVDATQEMLNSMRQANPELRVLQQTGMSLAGRPAVSILFDNVSPLPGERERDRLVTIRQSDYLLSLIFIAPERAYESYTPIFDQMLHSLETAN